VVLVLSLKNYLQTVKRVERLEEEFAMWRNRPAGVASRRPEYAGRRPV
jgi:hypothetical protein